MKENLKDHWETIYKTKQPNEVSWTQDVPAVSLEFIHKFSILKTAKIIDIGGGDSKLVDFLLAEGYVNLSVLDISEAAIQRAKERLGENAKKVKWIICDILDFKPFEKYDLWHDRAAFHFQTDPDKIEKYLSIVKNAVDGMVIIGTFSVDGPKKCSGLEIRQYDEDGMKEKFEKSDFKNVECKREDHITPAGAVQNFVFCSFMKKLVNSKLQEV
jgi:SAM-dependent methyltransferase